MPGVGSWNGKWTGDKGNYVIIKKFSSIKGKLKAKEILGKGDYYYRWDDGWAANIKVKEVTGKESTQLKRISDGFCSYEWMIDSILDYGAIYADHQKPTLVTA